jgi:hypothetical protein
MNIEDRIVVELKKLIVDLINKDYAKIVSDGRNGEMPEEVMEEIFNDYGGILTYPPEESFGKIDICKVDNRDEYSVIFDLWIDDKRSDLSLMSDAIIDDGEVVLVIEDIHVL